MDKFLPPEKFDKAVTTVQKWIETNLFDSAALVQLGIVAIAFVLAWLIAPRLRSLMQRIATSAGDRVRLRSAAETGANMALWVIWLFFQWLILIAAVGITAPNWLLELTTSLLAAWVVIRLASSFIGDQFWACLIGIVAFAIAALNIADLLEPTSKFLDTLAITLGQIRISALGIIKGLLVLAMLLWLAVLISDLLDRRIRNSRNISPSIQVLLSKVFRITFIVVAIAVGVNAVGIDLTAFAVFTGALGLGIGFGLQKVISNLVSGIILLLDRSIKPGDVIAVGNTYGWVNTMSARYVSLLTRDGIEHLIPNEDLITQRVENWSYSNSQIRVSIEFGVHYKSDIKLARDLALEAGREHERVLADPPPVCNIKEFGDSSVNMLLRVWVNDPQNGLGNIKGQILMTLWEKLHEHDIEIPYPQRDMHWRSEQPLTVRIERDAAASDKES
jgi:small-conductance mechanosensitive channel